MITLDVSMSMELLLRLHRNIAPSTDQSVFRSYPFSFIEFLAADTCKDLAGGFGS